jgi:hypothetical protein
MQIRIIIEHKYSFSHQKQICSYREERKEGVFVSISTYQERNIKISRTHPRLRVIGKINTSGQETNKKN